MNSAPGRQPKDLEKSKLPYHQQTIPFLDEKELFKREADQKSRQMAKAQHYIFFVLLFCLLSVGILAAAFNNSVQDVSQRNSAEESRFQQLLKAVDPTALYDVLHDNLRDKLRNGVYQEDKNAVEALHRQNAELAESLVELAKRQAGNTTVVTTTAVTTTEVTTTATASSPSAPVSTPVQSQTSPTPTSPQQSSVPETTPGSTPGSTPQPTPEPSTGPSTPSPTQVGSTPPPGTTSSSSPMPSSSDSTPNPSFPAPTSSVSTSTAGSSSGSVSSSDTKSYSKSTRTTTYTTTLPGGAVSTVTSVTVISVQADQTNPASGPTPTSDGNASLQTGGVGRTEIKLSAVIGGAAMMVMHALR